MASWSRSLTMRMTGRLCSFFVGFRPDGSVRRVYFGLPDIELLGERKAALAEMYTRWFLFAVDESEREIAYVEWLNLPQSVAERWVGRAFEDDDLCGSRGSLDGWPTHWRVIIR